MSRSRRVARGPARTVVTARGPADLVAAVPYLVGFVPTASVVVVSLRGPRLRLGLVARLDLPEPGAEAAAAASLADFVHRDGPRAAVVLVYDEQPWVQLGTRPRQALVDALETALLRLDVPVREAVYVDRQRFWSYTCTVDACCSPLGSPLRDAMSTEVAAAYVLEGRSPLPSRAFLVDRVAPGDPATRGEVADAVAAELSAAHPFWQQADDVRWRRWQRDGAAQFDALVRAYRAGGPAVTPAQAGAVLAAMLDVTTRDVLATRWTRWWEGLGGAPDPDGELGRQVALVADGPPPDLDDLDLVEAVERLLVDLVVRAPDAAAPAPLTLLAMQSWAGGDGAAAGVAVDRALAIDPAYRMAALVDRLLRAGFAPRWVGEDRADDARLVSQHARRHLMPW